MFINMKLGDVVEPKPVPAGRYHVTVASAEYNVAKSQDKSDNIMVSIGVDEHPTAPNIRHFISMPKEGEESSKSQFKMLMAKRFLRQFAIQYDETRGFEISDFAGATASVQVGLDEPNDKGVMYNRLDLDRIPGEGE